MSEAIQFTSIPPLFLAVGGLPEITGVWSHVVYQPSRACAADCKVQPQECELLLVFSGAFGFLVTWAAK